MRPPPRLGGAALAAPLALWSLGAAAASLDVNPVRIDIAGSARSAELRLTNTATEELSVQVDVREWYQDSNGADELVETEALLAVPPLVTIPPGERQIVRIGHLGEPAAGVEKSFRVLVTELAPSPGAADRSALSMRLRLSIPVFVAPASGAAAPEVVIDAADESAGEGLLTLRNAGNGHVKIEQIELSRGGEWSALPAETLNQMRYLLPSARTQLAIPQGLADLEAIRITSTDRREWQYAVWPAQ
jgi:fimbrial chaperone protein